MKKFRNIAIVLLVLMTVTILVLGIVYKINMKAVDKDDDTLIEVVIPEGSSIKKIGEILKEKDLIRSSTFFNIYVKLFDVKELKASKYNLSKSMSFEEIIDTLEEGNSYNESQISLTFREGITMRDIAKEISDKTVNEYDDVIKLSNDEDYIDELIKKYWFITEDIKNEDLYYKLEGYLFPETYFYSNENVSIKEIFGKMLDEMETKLDPYKKDIEKNELSVHEILTLASMIEKESPNIKDEEKNLNYKKNISSVFLNRIKSKMSLGSDVTTYYSLKIDNAKKYIDEKCGGRNCIDYNTKSPYNTRLNDGTMNGKLPIGPISTVSKNSIEAAVKPSETDYLYFLANIQTGETFFFENYTDFQKKKNDLQSVNAGL